MSKASRFASHRILVDRKRKLVDVRLSGFVSPEDVRHIAVEVGEAVRSLGPDVGQHVTLYDGSDIQLLPPEAIEVLKRGFDSSAVRSIWARKVAFVFGSRFGRLQAERLRAVRPDFGIFEDRDSAIAWLMAP